MGMLKVFSITLAIIASVANAQQQPPQQPQQQQFASACLANFDRAYRQCFQQNGNFQLDTIFSLITNGSSGPLPAGTDKQQLVKQLCSVRESQDKCAEPVPSTIMQNAQLKCTPQEKSMMESTFLSTKRAVAGLCGVPPEMPPCLSKFDSKFRACMSQNQLVPDYFFKFLANSTEGLQMPMTQLNQTICSRKQLVLQCASASIQQLASECNKQEQMMVGQTLQNMMVTFQALCVGAPPPPPPGSVPPCLQKFEEDMEKCSKENTKLGMPDLMNLLTKGVVPAGTTNAQLNQTICGNSKKMEACGKKAVADSGCQGSHLLIAEGTFANVFITTGAYCRDTTMPGACMLTMQSEFTKCYAEVGLNKEDYVGEVSSHKGALIGTNRQTANAYCRKRNPLYACMRTIMHRCPGAEQTMTLTGFDLTSMERAVDALCADIDEYLAGLACFEKPSPQSMKCIDDMGQAVTSMSAQEMAKGLSLKSFFNTFCDIRMKHVKCDSEAWPSCDSKAVQLKKTFECQLLPSNCHKMFPEEIDALCPENAKIKPHLCLEEMKSNYGSCVLPYGIDPALLLVNVTLDRTGLLGDVKAARRFCDNKERVYQCMHDAMDSCNGAVEIVERWGHQQNQIEEAINVVCNDLASYEASLQCMPSTKNSVASCNAQSAKSVSTFINAEVANPVYFRQFCAVRLDNLQCELNAFKSTCSNRAAVGLKTEVECKLVQDRCHASHATQLKQVCNEANYMRNERSQNANRVLQTSNINTNTPNAGDTSGNTQENGAGAVRVSVLSTLVGVFTTAMVLLF